VWFAFDVDTTKFPLASSEYVGVRVWNAGGAGLVDDVRIAYGVTGDFVATLEMPEN
jgi:hypothetical protein